MNRQRNPIPPYVMANRPAPEVARDGFTIDKTPPKPPQPAAQESRSGCVGTIARIINAFIFIINLIVAMGLVFTCYAEQISPIDWAPSVVVTMTLPFWVMAAIFLLIVDLLWWKRTSLIIGVAMLSCVTQIHQFLPLNTPRLGMSDKQEENAFTLMTYNVYCFQEYDRKDYGRSRQLSYILRQDPDIVCIQEAEFMKPTDANKIQTQQLDSIYERYPYYLTSGRNFALLSKYPAQPINLDFPVKDYSSGDMAAWRLHVKNRVINLFSVHLRSLSLTPEDKNAYSDIVKLDSVSEEMILDARLAIIPKIEAAGIERASQVQHLERYLNKYGGENAIVCGDFNDPVGCYGLYLLKDKCRMQQAYAQTGFWPMITYYPQHLYFRIDHVLYRGKMWPYSMRRGKIKASDHYPLTTTFVLK